MYCVYCGVRLQDGAAECPLCRTPVMHPDRPESGPRTLYPDRLPEEERTFFSIKTYTKCIDLFYIWVFNF